MSDNKNKNQQVEELDINHLMQVRREKLKELQEQGKDPYEITKFDRTNTAGEIKQNYEKFEQKDVTLSCCSRNIPVVLLDVSVQTPIIEGFFFGPCIFGRDSGQAADAEAEETVVMQIPLENFTFCKYSYRDIDVFSLSQKRRGIGQSQFLDDGFLLDFGSFRLFLCCLRGGFLHSQDLEVIKNLNRYMGRISLVSIVAQIFLNRFGFD